MGGHQHRNALCRQRMDLVPEVAPRLGVHAGRGLIEQQQARLMDQAGGQRQALLPAARERAGQLALALRETQALQRKIHGSAALGQLKQARHKVQVLADGEVVIEAELLRHVAHLALDGGGVFEDVQPQATAAAAVRREQAAEHAYGGGLAAAIGPQKAADATGPHLQIDLVHHGAPRVMLAQALHVNCPGAHGAARSTSSGCPGLSCRALIASGLASTMNTSLLRWLLE